MKSFVHAGFKNRIGLHPVCIYFDTSIFDKITYDVKATLSEKCFEIGGVLGLYNGFSVITLVEILYFLFRAILIIIQGIEGRFCIGQRVTSWIHVLRQMAKRNKKAGNKDKKEEETSANTSKPNRDEIDVEDIE